MRLFAAYNFLLRGLCALFAIGLASIVFLTGIDVALRYLSLGNVPWLLEVFEYTLFVGTFLAAPWALRQGAHVRIDIVTEIIDTRTAVILEVISDCLGLLLSCLLFFYGIRAVLEAYYHGMIQYKTLHMPEAILLSAIPISGTLLGIEFLLRMLRVHGVLSVKSLGSSEEGN